MGSKIIMVLFTTAVVYSTALGQKSLVGAYEGGLLTPKGLLVIHQHKDSVLNGTVYTSPLDYVSFFGIAGKGQIRGTIMETKDRNYPVVLKGHRIDKGLQVTLVSSLDSSVLATSTLVRVSRSAKFDPEITFGRVKPEFDQKLVGFWRSVPSENPSNTKLSGHSMEYFSNGTWTMHDPELDALRAKYGGSSGKHATYTWFTQGDKLKTIIKLHFPPGILEKAAAMGITPPPDTTEITVTYRIKGDTLIKTYNDHSVERYVKKTP
jgi:hypothetical protein